MLAYARSSLVARVWRELRFEMAPNEIEFLSRRRFWKVKRGLDILAALTCLIVSSPFFVIIGLSVGVSMGFPVVFWQRRPGLLWQVLSPL